MKLHEKKIRAGALQFVLFVGTVIAVLLIAFVLLHQTHQLFDKKTVQVIEVVKRADMGIQYAMEHDLEGNVPLDTDLGLDDGIKVAVSRSYWGMFELYKAQSSFKKTSFTKLALVGGRLEQNASTLYLKDNERPMIIAGSAKITGTALVPEQGIRPGGIGGHFYQYNRPVYGAIKQSRSSLPNVNEGVKMNLEQLLENENFGNRGNIRYQAGMQAENSFESIAKYVYGDVLRFSKGALRGNIVVKARGSITIGAEFSAKDVIFVAPKIIVEPGFQGSLQLVASEEIEIGKGVSLEYPSAVIVDRGNIPHSKNRRDPHISIEDNAVVNGIVGYFGIADDNVLYPQIRVGEKARVRGEIFCEKALELKGEVWGKVITDGFIAMESGGVYQNHLFNGIINLDLLPIEYGGLLQNKPKTVVKWMY